MSTQPLVSEYRQHEMLAGKKGLDRSPYSIHTSVRVRAETRRLFQAVFVPEYLEAWLRVPEEGALWDVKPLPQSEGFILDWSNGGVRSRIVGVYKTCRRRKLMIEWNLNTRHHWNESSVIMRLSGDFGNSILSLCHSGIETFDDFAWHWKLWNASLERLARLF